MPFTSSGNANNPNPENKSIENGELSAGGSDSTKGVPSAIPRKVPSLSKSTAYMDMEDCSFVELFVTVPVI
jgi:hypothetical protein